MTILLFTIIFPIIKYIYLILNIFTQIAQKQIKLSGYFKNLGKWSMVDVFVISILVVIFKLGKGFFSVKINVGTIFFALSVLTSIIVNSLLEKNYVQKRIREKKHNN